MPKFDEYVQIHCDSDAQFKQHAQQLSHDFCRSYLASPTFTSLRGLETYLLSVGPEKPNTLNSEEYRNAKDRNEREKLIRDWISGVKKYDEKLTNSSFRNDALLRDYTNSQSQNHQYRDDILELYQNIVVPISNSESSKSSRKNRKHQTNKEIAREKKTEELKVAVVEEKNATKTNIGKNKGEKESIAISAPTVKSQQMQNLEVLVKTFQESKIVDRGDLVRLTNQLYRMRNDEVYGELYKLARNMQFQYVDPCNAKQMSKIITLGYQKGLDNIPENDRRVLANFLIKAIPNMQDQVRAIDSVAWDAIKNESEKLIKLVDNDVFHYATALAQYFPEGTYVIPHNYIPILRYLYNKNKKEAIANYIKICKLDETTNNIGYLGNVWDKCLCFSEPRIIGKAKVYASLPFAQSMSMFM